MAGATGPKRQDTRKFFENLSGAGKSIAVLTSGGDAQAPSTFPSTMSSFHVSSEKSNHTAR
ncbi:hypothetical protein ATANTOWER_011137, partial [Ataeniobius toweri]|nr:hypothetical protein [Ataeniobius toweri]